MKNLYHYIIYLFFSLFSLTIFAQEGRQQPKTQDISIEGLSFYPNPVSNGKIYITSKTGGDKEVVIYDVLGKKVLQANLNTKELNISSISPGVYIIKIREGEATSTRKLMIK
jgi:hypothetical protein